MDSNEQFIAMPELNEANKHIIFVRYHIVLRRYENKLNADLQSFVLKFSKIMVKIQLSALKPKQYGVKF